MKNAKAGPNATLLDLDGTLVDSAPDLANATNLLLAEYEHPPLSIDQIRDMIGNGVAKLVERAFRASGEAIDTSTLKMRTDQMMAIYSQHLTDESFLLAGARDALLFCKDMGILTGVVTNKPEAAARQILVDFKIADLVQVVVGGDTCPTRKPNPEMLIYAMQALGLGPQSGLMVGDSPADINAAIACSMRSIAVRGGYTTVPVEELGADTILNSLNDLPSTLPTITN